MSSSCKLKPGCYGRDIHRMLLAAEAGQKADIHTYCSGHLGPHGLIQNKPHRETNKSFWRMSQSQKETPHIQKRHTKTPAKITKKESKDTEVKTRQGRPGQHQAAPSSHADRSENTSLPEMDVANRLLVKPRADQTKLNSSSEKEEKQKFGLSHSDQVGLTKNDQPKMKSFGKQDLREQSCMAAGNMAEMHESKLQKELKKLSVQSWPSRDCLAVFSDVFDDVCDGSPVFGRILREIKTDYDLYLNHIMASQSSLQDMLLNTSVEKLRKSKVSVEELEEAEEEVCRLEVEARRALEENKRVQNELQNVAVMIRPEDSGTKSSSQHHIDWALSEFLQDNETASGNTIRLHTKRLQVWNMWKETGQLEQEIKEQMLSTATVTATERCIKDTKAEIMRLIASNDRLRSINKDLEQNINTVLNREKASKAIRGTLWDEIKCGLQTDGE